MVFTVELDECPGSLFAGRSQTAPRRTSRGRSSIRPCTSSVAIRIMDASTSDPTSAAAAMTKALRPTVLMNSAPVPEPKGVGRGASTRDEPRRPGESEANLGDQIGAKSVGHPRRQGWLTAHSVPQESRSNTPASVSRERMGYDLPLP